jgi:ABC-type phosphonate transport system ATPase subunit
MGYSDDGKNALAILKLAEAQRRMLMIFEAYFVANLGDEDNLRTAAALIDSAEKDARGVDNGKHRDTEVNP